MNGAGPLCLCEGFATGASIHEATGYPVAVGFNAGNLLAVAKALRKRFPELDLLVCADDDVCTPGNPGLAQAKEAAYAIGGRLAVPDFGENRPEGATDFNDLHRHAGLEAVARCIEAAAPGTQTPSGDNSTNHHDKRAGPVIEIRAGELPRIFQDAISALKGAKVPIYDRGGALYRPVRVETPPKENDEIRRPVGALVLRPVDSIWTRITLAAVANWLK
jgi:hypothetical protein